jgi:hypothetical protein
MTEWIGIALYAALVVQYFILWVKPGPDDGARIATLTMMVIFEFVLGHSGVFMSVFPRRVALIVFVPFYGLFALALNASLPGNAIMVLYCGVVLMRMRFIFSDPSEDAKFKSVGMSIISLFLFMVCIIGFSAASDVLPQLGLTSEYLSAIDFRNITSSSGDFVDAPHAAMAMGMTYFTLLAMFEILVYGLLQKHEHPA